MRPHLLLGLVLLPTLVHAEPTRAPKRDVIWGTHPTRPPALFHPHNLTSIPHVIYMNNCLSGNCTLQPGNDDVHLRQSSIAEQTVTLTPWSYGTAAWNDLVTCVQATYAPFNITVTDVDPGAADHSEIIVAGRASELNSQLTNAGGVAPFLGCGAVYDNTISFMFAEDDGDQLNYLCGGAAQETSHVFGLDHELNADDPMTYLNLGSHKVFQDNDAQCGETAGQPRECYSLFDPGSACAGPTQNSFRYLLDHFGPANLLPATMTIVQPMAGAYVEPGFQIKVTVDDQLSIISSTVGVDGQQGSPVQGATTTLTAPTALAGGDHVVTVTSTDEEQRTVTAMVNVHVLAACSATAPCADKTTGCASGYCSPLSDTAGGLGSTCTSNDGCILGTCASGATQSGTAEMLCSGTCTGAGSCGTGFDCIPAGSQMVCWPSEKSSSSGCSTTGGAPSSLLLLGLVGWAASRRPRRRRRPRR